MLKGESIPVGLPDVDLSRLKSIFGEEKVAKSLNLWSQFIAKITAQPVQEMVFAAASPQEAWRVFESHYAVKGEDERGWRTNGMNCVRRSEKISCRTMVGQKPSG